MSDVFARQNSDPFANGVPGAFDSVQMPPQPVGTSPEGQWGDVPPPPGYSPTTYPVPGPEAPAYPAPGYAPGYAAPGYATPGYPPPGYPPPGYPPPGYGAPGYAPPGYGAPGYAPQGYAAGYPSYGYPMKNPATERNWQGLVSMIIGIVGFFLNWLLFVLWIPGLIFGILGLVSASSGRANNRGQSIAGIVLSGLWMVGLMGLVIYFAITGEQ